MGLSIKINRVKNKIEIYWDEIPYLNIPLKSYAGLQSWIEYDKPNTPYWIEVYTKDRDYEMAFDKRENWIIVLNMLNEIEINS